MRTTGGTASDAAPARYRTAIGAASLIVGPAMMSVGDLIHPAETWNAPAQIAIVAVSASRWYGAHLLLFLGMLLFVPGILALTKVVATRRPAAGYAARLLLLASVGALSAVFVFEMVLGRFIAAGADQSAAVALPRSFPVGCGSSVRWGRGCSRSLIGTALAVLPLVSTGRSISLARQSLSLLGAILIMGEIILAEVRLSQIGNILVLVAGIGFASLLLRGRSEAPA